MKDNWDIVRGAQTTGEQTTAESIFAELRNLEAERESLKKVRDQALGRDTHIRNAKNALLKKFASIILALPEESRNELFSLLAPDIARIKEKQERQGE